MQNIKQKKCKNCPVVFTPKQPLQNCCSTDCFYEYKNAQDREKIEKKREKQALQYQLNEALWSSKTPYTVEQIMLSKPLIKRLAIAHKSKTSKNTARSLDDETIREVYTRDEFRCIVPGCGKTTLDLPHHAYFGGIQANRWPDRNEPHQLVTLCTDCHYLIHSKGDQGRREFCIDYLKEHYAKN